MNYVPVDTATWYHLLRRTLVRSVILIIAFDVTFGYVQSFSIGRVAQSVNGELPD